MPGSVRPVTDERDALLAYLAQQRHVLTLTSYGLNEEQARAVPSASELSVGGLIKHVDHVERYWIDTVLQRQTPRDPEADWTENFRLGPDETLAGTVARYEQAAVETETVLAGLADLGQPVPVPRDAPWWPADVEAWSVRWVLLHLIAETARHAGHADIVRQCIDGATAFPLMAAAEQWPASPWMTPWTPEVERV
ncbi:MAG: DinB family protein [Acidimicrobiales bacterium]|jgi:hypothetical protein